MEHIPPVKIMDLPPISDGVRLMKAFMRVVSPEKREEIIALAEASIERPSGALAVSDHRLDEPPPE